MCVVSNIIGAGQQIWPSPNTYTPWYAQPPGPTPEQWAAFQELVEKARKFDELAGQPDCEDPQKTEWMRQIEERLAQLEERD